MPLTAQSREALTSEDAPDRQGIASRKLLGGTAVKRSRLGWACLCTFIPAVLAFAQTATTSLRGTIKDSSGALVTKTTINLTDKATGKIYSTTTDSAGSYIFPQIFPSRYS